MGLNRKGEALSEHEDHLVAEEEPEVVAESLKVMKENLGIPQAAVARQMLVEPELLLGLLAQPGADDNASLTSLRRETVR